jgi:hypothetical protein
MTRRWLSLTCAVGAAALAACTPDNPTAPPAAALGSAPSTRPSFALSGGVSGANFTTTNPNWDRPKAGTTPKLCLHGQDLQTGTNNCNIYGAKPYLWLNGGPMAAGLESGTYFWAVLAPGGQPDPNDGSAKNLSDDTDPVSNRTFSWNKGTGAITYSGTHDFDPVTQKLRVGVKPPLVKKGPDWFADTPNPGGVYILAICRISAPSSAPVNPRDCKYDAFKIKDQPGNPEVMVSIVPNGVNEVAKDHKFTVTVKAVGGRLPYTFQITPTVDPAAGLKSETCTDATKHVVVDEFVRTCDVTVNSSAVGLVKVNVAAKVTDANGNAATATTGPSNLPSSDDGYKYYVDAHIRITPDGKNGIGEPHTFTAVFTAKPGTLPSAAVTFNYLTVTVTPPAGFVKGSDYTETAAPCTTSGDGLERSCAVTINSTKAGTFTAAAKGQATIAGVIAGQALSDVVVRETDGTTTPSDLQNSLPATKIYYDGKIRWNKVDEEGLKLAGAEFRAERIADRFGSALSPSDPIYLDIADCTAAPCAAGAGKDQDAAKGQFELVELALGTWRVTETKAPANYTADLATYQDITIELPPNSSGAAAKNFVNVGKYAGCTPGFWKQDQHFGYWQDSPYSPVPTRSLVSQAFSSYNGQGGFSAALTMIDALDLNNSTGVGQLLRHGTAALLNAYSKGVFYGFQDDPENIKAFVNKALESGDQGTIDAAHAKLAAYNELGCTLSGQKFWQ